MKNTYETCLLFILTNQNAVKFTLAYKRKITKNTRRTEGEEEARGLQKLLDLSKGSFSTQNCA